MPATGDTAPDFTAPLANGDVDSFTLSEELSDGPLVLAFFPGAFTSVCSHEMSTFDDQLGKIAENGATLYGVSVDSPFALNAFRDELGIDFDLISDAEKSLIEEYDVSMDFDALGVYDVAKRAVFVIDSDGEITFTWVSDDPGVEPEYEEVIEAVNAAN
ncbi:redoxin domain-containing protein [Halocatena halophila]|uniref:redoxin domain-containing protein n=1 Tax=Halocatena halophila TaxID=2814576 RepID=UPI002ED4DD29